MFVLQRDKVLREYTSWFFHHTRYTEKDICTICLKSGWFFHHSRQTYNRIYKTCKLFRERVCSYNYIKKTVDIAY